MNTIALFFGAGAEIDYGFPSGGQFALDVFRLSADEAKHKLRSDLDALDANSVYAADWLPPDYRTKRLYSFGKAEYGQIIASSLEYRRDSIVAYLENFDKNAEAIAQRHGLDISRAYQEATNSHFGSTRYTHSVRLNRRLAESVNLFDSRYFSALLHMSAVFPHSKGLRDVLKAVLELLVGSYGQRLVSELNDQLFEEVPENVPVFDDLGGIFDLNYARLGELGLEIVLEQRPDSTSTDPVEVFVALGHQILDDIYGQALDYQALIDENFRYIYTPHAQWAKFTRIVIFLRLIEQHFQSLINENRPSVNDGPGYYHDLLNALPLFDVCGLGTSNYNTFMETMIRGSDLANLPVYQLNGRLDEAYDPYTNSVHREQGDKPNHLLVPFMFPQSGIKPMTSVHMARRYVDMYDSFKRADLICIVGYGFNGDDGHINGIFRELAEVEGKHLAIVDVERHTPDYYQSRLRLSTSDRVHAVTVDRARQVADGCLWTDKVRAILDEMAVSLEVVGES